MFQVWSNIGFLYKQHACKSLFDFQHSYPIQVNLTVYMYMHTHTLTLYLRTTSCVYPGVDVCIHGYHGGGMQQHVHTICLIIITKHNYKHFC